MRLYVFLILFGCGFLFASHAYSQQGIRITGTVTDETDDPMSGVAVVVSGTAAGTTTDWNGVFTIHVPGESSSLKFSFIGYGTQEIAVGNRQIINVQMQKADDEMGEIVLTGYGQQKKSAVTGSLATITTADLKRSPVSNLSNALVGRMPGLLVNQFSGGEPGADYASLYVRGMGTYNTAHPITIVDGVERDFFQLTADEVETITILKDASATAVYGSRGANGVILVTTKHGKSEKAVVSLKASVGRQAHVKVPTYLGSADYATLYNEALDNDGNNFATRFSPSAIENFRKAKGDNSDGLGYDMDLYDYAFKPSWQQDYSLSVSGGSLRTRYFVLASYLNQNGNYKHTDLEDYNTQAKFQRYNFRTNIDVAITDDWYVRLDLGGRAQERFTPGTSAAEVVELANTTPPYFPIYVDDNNNPANQEFRDKNPSGMLFGNQIYRRNILGELRHRGYRDEYKNYMQGNFIMGYKLDKVVQGLKVEGMFSYDTSFGGLTNRLVNTVADGYRVYNGYALFYPKDGGVDYYMDVAGNGTNGRYSGEYLFPRLTQNNVIGNELFTKDDAGKGVTGLNPDKRMYGQFAINYARAFGQHYVTGLLLANRTKQTVANQSAFCRQGVVARFTYNFADRYLLEASGSYTGSENFARDHRYGLFPAFSAGWIVSNEGFFDSGFFDFLKLRGSFGLTGYDQIPGDRFSYMLLYRRGGDYQGGQDFNSGFDAGWREGTLMNPNLTWEKAKKTNIGIDLRALNSRLSLTADVFFENRYDILTVPNDDRKRPSQVVGKPMATLNIGKVENRGVDFEIGWRDRYGDFSYYIRPVLTFARNKIVEMDELARISSSGQELPWAKRTGRRIGEQFVYEFDHFVADQAEADRLNQMEYQPWEALLPGDVVYKDLNGDNKISDQEDRKAMGHPRNPELQFGIPVGVQYKGFDLNVLFQGSANTSIMLTGPAAWEFPLYAQDIVGKVKPVHLGRWTPATANSATYPRLHYENNNNNKNGNSSFFLQNASYVRLKTVEIGYTLPKNIVSKAGMSNVRFYIQGLNLVTWDKLSDYDIDPETGDSNGNWYPVQKIYNFGVNIDF